MSVNSQSLLDAMDGIALILDADLRIIQLGDPNWQEFLSDNPPPDRALYAGSGMNVLNRRITDFFAGEEVRQTFANLFNKVLLGARPYFRVDHRCDSPELRRDMRLSVSRILTAGKAHHLLYQSVTLTVQQRPPIPLFAVPIAERCGEDILTVCAICARIAWPVGAPTGDREWIGPSDYYQRGGGDVGMISHGFCENCFVSLQHES